MQINRPLLLASKSPRRSQLLREAGFRFRVIGLDVDEDFPADMPLEEVAPYLARRKALAAVHLIEGDEVVLSADSVVILENQIFNKPADYDEAFSMIRQLAGKQHTVITGVCLISAEREKTFSGVTRVWFADMTDDEIDFYIKNYQPFDKAGSYGAQDWIGWCKINRLEGTYANVMGLPVDLVYQALQEF